jgi:hypothetical protein
MELVERYLPSVETLNIRQFLLLFQLGFSHAYELRSGAAMLFLKKPWQEVKRGAMMGGTAVFQPLNAGDAGRLRDEPALKLGRTAER